MKKDIKILTENQHDIAQLEYFEESDDYVVSILLKNDKKYLSTGTDYFRALQNLRKDLQNFEIQICCQGARYDVYPSRMSQQMGGALVAYIMQIGESAKSEDQVRIFDSYQGEKLGSVEEQEAYYQRWIKSLREI